MQKTSKGTNHLPKENLGFIINMLFSANYR